MHYTSIENIHKVIDPLFLDALEDELNEIAGQRNKSAKTRFEWSASLAAYRQKLASLRILDPACGSGNFLTETYLRLRKLENRVLQHIHGEQMAIGEFDPIQVSIKQFYGIEINDFAVEVAKTALWIAELQMLAQTKQILANAPFEPLPLKDNANIHCANALRLDWNDVLPASQCNYIIGNPPFLGYSTQTEEQKDDVVKCAGEYVKNAGSLDYVAGWYFIASRYIHGRAIRCAFVSTNSICQGEQAAWLWKPLFERGLQIDFAYRTFVWNSEAPDQAHVHCVIVAFSECGVEQRIIYIDGQSTQAKNINAYLSDAPTVFVESRMAPLCDVG